MLDRADERLTQAARRENGLTRSIAETFRSNFWIATSGMFSSSTTPLALWVLGAEQIMFSIGYPFGPAHA